jgi:excisionase family DNA binding protein
VGNSAKTMNATNDIIGHAPVAAEPELDRKGRFAQRVAVSPRTIDNWMADGRIPFLKIGRTVRIPWRQALEVLNRNYRLNAREE